MYSTGGTPHSGEFGDLARRDRAGAVAAAWLESGRIPHAVLICGAEGTGKRRFALAWAKALLCIGSGPSACNLCPSCRKIASLMHPDLHTALPLPPRRGKQKPSPADLHESLVEYVRGASASLPSNANIAVDHLRQLQRELAFAPTESRRKVGLIFAAERMQPAGANSLLKLLEEPPARAVVALVSAAPERLLPTVLSRCQRMILNPLDAATLRAQLESEGVVGECLELAVRMGAGSLQQAKEVAAGAFDGTRRLVESFLSGGSEQRDEVYWSVLEELGGDRGQLERFFTSLRPVSTGSLPVGARPRCVRHPGRSASLFGKLAGEDRRCPSRLGDRPCGRGLGAQCQSAVGVDRPVARLAPWGACAGASTRSQLG